MNEEPDIVQLVEKDSDNIGEHITPESVFIATWYRDSNYWTTSGEVSEVFVALLQTETLTINEICSYLPQSLFTTELSWYVFQLQENTFQAVIATEGYKTITVFNYGRINWLNKYNSTAVC